jgi:hypothetical protein
MNKRTPAKRTHKPAAQFDFANQQYKLMMARLKAGCYRDDPELEAALLQAAVHHFDPAVVLTEIIFDPRNQQSLRGIFADKLMPYRHQEQSLVLKTGDNVGAQITINIASWAAGPGIDGAPKAIEAKPAIDHVADDRGLAAHRQPGSIVTPEVVEPAYTVYEMDNGRTVKSRDIYPAKRPLLNPHTGRPYEGSPPETIVPVDLGDGPFSKS